MDKNKDEKRNNEILDLYKKGVSVAKIAKIYDISRIRVYQILDELKVKYENELDKK